MPSSVVQTEQDTDPSRNMNGLFRDLPYDLHNAHLAGYAIEENGRAAAALRIARSFPRGCSVAISWENPDG